MGRADYVFVRTGSQQPSHYEYRNHYDQNKFIMTEVNYHKQTQFFMALTNCSNSFVAFVADIRIHRMKSVQVDKMTVMSTINYFTSKLSFDL